MIMHSGSMGLRKLITLVVATYLLPFGGLHTANPANHLSIQLLLDKNTFVSGEEIYVDCLIDNKTSSEIALHDLLKPGAWKIRLYDHNGQVIPPRYGPPLKPDDLELGGHSSIRVTTSLLAFDNANDATGSAGELLPGKYRLSLSLANGDSGNAEFSVVGRSEEEQTIHEYLNRRVVRFKSRQSAINDCKELLSRYPNSVFVPNFYHELLVLMNLSPDLPEGADLAKTAKEYIAQFPDFGGTFLAAMYLEYGLERQMQTGHSKALTRDDIEAIRTELEKVRADFPGKKIANYVSDELRNLKSKYSNGW